MLLSNLKQFLEYLSKAAGENISTIDELRNAFKGKLISKEDVLAAYKRATNE